MREAELKKQVEEQQGAIRQMKQELEERKADLDAQVAERESVLRKVRG